MKKILFVSAAAAFLISINVSAASIASGDITFATLDTAVSGDQPNNEINATIIDGKYKGAKLHGKLVAAKAAAGDPDRVNLQFTSMDVAGESKPVKIAAFAIDANTARTALSSKADTAYLRKNGTILGAAFIEGFAQKIDSVKINSGTDIGVLF